MAYKLYYSSAATLTDDDGDAVTAPNTVGEMLDAARMWEESVIYVSLSWDRDVWTVDGTNPPRLYFEEDGFREEVDIEQLPGALTPSVSGRE